MSHQSLVTQTSPNQNPPIRDWDYVLASSMKWWAGNIVQGLFSGIGPILLALMLVQLYFITDDYNALLVAFPLLLVGLVYLIWFGLAPVTRKWIVTVPENEYYVVEAKNGAVFAYVGAGQHRVPWHMNTLVRKYADFKTISVYEHFEDVEWADGTVGYIEFKVTMAFDPAQADPSMYAALYEMTQPDAFATMIRRDLRDFVRHQSKLLTWEEVLLLIRGSRVLEGAVTEALEPWEAMGLTPGGERAIRVFADDGPSVKG